MKKGGGEYRARKGEMGLMHQQRQIQLPSDVNGTGRTFGEEELRFLQEVIVSGTLNCTKGAQGVQWIEKGYRSFETGEWENQQ